MAKTEKHPGEPCISDDGNLQDNIMATWLDSLTGAEETMLFNPWEGITRLSPEKQQEFLGMIENVTETGKKLTDVLLLFGVQESEYKKLLGDRSTIDAVVRDVHAAPKVRKLKKDTRPQKPKQKDVHAAPKVRKLKKDTRPQKPKRKREAASALSEEREAASALSEEDERSIAEITELAKLYCDGIRLWIIMLLNGKGELNVRQIRDHLSTAHHREVSQPDVSSHLKRLRNRGHIDYEKRGKHNVYHLNADRLTKDIAAFVQSCERLDHPLESGS